MKLGNYVHISLSVAHLGDSLSFFEKLGFTKLWSNTNPSPWTLLTDGSVNVHLFEMSFASPVLSYFANDMAVRVDKLREYGITCSRKMNIDGSLVQDIFFDPNEMEIALIHYDDSEMPRSNGASFSKCGKFSELIIPTSDINSSITFWKRLGFRKTVAGSVPYQWTSMTDNLISIGLHETESFTQPIITYRGTNMAERLDKLSKAGINSALTLTQPNGEQSNGILQSPDGQILFLLSDEVQG